MIFVQKNKNLEEFWRVYPVAALHKLQIFVNKNAKNVTNYW